MTDATVIRSSPVFARVRRWLFDDALPYWARHGVDRVDGGYVEHFNVDASDANVPYKRTRVIGRQMYVFSHAYLNGWTPGLELARHGFEFLVRNAWLGPERGWAARLDRYGAVIDDGQDLYDLAFVLFALGWYGRASGEPAAADLARETTRFIDRHMRHANGLGFVHRKPATGPRLQNPHMHLLEAALVNLEATGEARYRALADELVGWFRGYFFDAETRTLGEYFTEDLAPTGGAEGRLTEPGHQFEWAWILASYGKLTGADVTPLVLDLIATGEAHGVSPTTHETWNSVDRDGKAIDAGTRVWPNTERIKAAVAAFECVGRDPTVVFEQSVGVLFDRFFRGMPPGTWREEFDAQGKLAGTRLPSSTLYHLTLAFLEMLRIEERVGSLAPPSSSGSSSAGA